jgi:uncharacterized protein (TIGR03118 family)
VFFTRLALDCEFPDLNLGPIRTQAHRHFLLLGGAGTVKHRNALYSFAIFLFGFLLAAGHLTAQTIGYRQTNLASSLPSFANNVTPNLSNPWGIDFLSGQPFFIANHEDGRVTTLDATGLGVAPGSLTVPNGARTGFEHPTGIVADQNSSFGNPSLVKPFILVTEEGTIFTWGPDAQGNLPQEATPVRKRSSAVYKGATILNSSLTAPALAVTDFHEGFIETFLPGFASVALPGSFTDPNLPAGYAPFGIQVIGRQVFVTYALQDAAKHDPVFGAGNGIVSIFDMDGNFVRRFATAGALNAPWGITQASANFGPFSNDILIGNVGDGTINAFDPTSGNFVRKLIDGDANDIVEVGLHALAFRSDGVGDPNTLYFTSQVDNENDGLFAKITTGFVCRTRVSAPDTQADTSVTITATVVAGPGNPGAPTGTVTFLDGASLLGTSPLINGVATLNAVFTDVGAHTINAQYSGDASFLSSSDRIPLQVTALATVLTLAAPADAAPGASITLTATIYSAGGIPTGQVAFLDGTTSLGTSPLNGVGVAILRINTLSTGTHIVTASYDGDGKFGGSTSAGATINIANADFSLGAAPSTATVIAGQSTQFLLTVTPAGGFANNVTWSCSPIAGITCTFNPAVVTPANGTGNTTLTVTTSATIPRYGLVMPDLIGPHALLVALALLSLAILRCGKVRNARASMLTATASLAIVALLVTLGGCGGYGSGMRTNRGTALIMVTAQSGSIAHTTTVSVTVQ